MELEERLQKLSKQHSEHRWTLPFLVWRCFYAEYSISGRCAGYRRVLGSIPGAPLCDVSIQAAQLRSVLGSAHRLYITNGTKTQISADLQNKQK